MDVSYLLTLVLIFASVVKCNAINCTELQDRFSFEGPLGKVKMSSIEMRSQCAIKRCIVKCNKMDEFILIQESTKVIKQSDFTALFNRSIEFDYSVQVFEGNSEADAQLVTRNLKEDFLIVRNKGLVKDCISQITMKPETTHYLYQNGSLMWVRLNYYKMFMRQMSFGNFCFEHVVVVTKEGVIEKPFIVYRYFKDYENDSPSESNTSDTSNSLYRPILLLVSCVFLILAFIVHGMIMLHQLWGMIVMSYVATFCLGLFLKALMIIVNQNPDTRLNDCKPLSLVTYFALLSAFFWMNVMSFDVWRTFRHQSKANPCRSEIEQRKYSLKKFAKYALYAWGVPLVVTSAVAYIDYVDLTSTPRMFKPHFEFCFHLNRGEGMIELQFYLYYPILSLILCNFLFLAMTIRAIMAIKDMSKHNNKANNEGNVRIFVYLKLSLVMGVSWVFEVVPLPWWLETVANIYNGLTGLFIFIIFVCKRNILLKLCNRMRIEGELVDRMRRKSSAATTSTLLDRKRSDRKTSTIAATPSANPSVMKKPQRSLLTMYKGKS